MNVVVLSRNIGLYSTQRLLLECRRRGLHVEVVDPLTCNIIIDDGRHQVIDHTGEQLNPDWVLPRIGSTATNFGAAIIRQFELQGIPVTTPSQSLLNARDKLVAMQLLAGNGVAVPKTALLSPLEIADDMIMREFDFPAIIKLLDSTHGLGVILSESHQNGIAIIEAFQRLQQKFIIQQFIKESAGQDIRVFIVDGKIIASMIRSAVEGEYRSNMHRGATAQNVHLTDEEALLALKSSETLGLGVAGVDIMRSRKGPVVLEVNASPGLEGIEGATKTNVAGAIIDYGVKIASNRQVDLNNMV